MHNSSPASVFYPVSACTFDGSTGYLKRLVSELNIHAGTFSCWFNLAGGNGTNMSIFSAYSGTIPNITTVNITRNSSNVIDVKLVSGGGSTLTFEYSTVGTHTSGGGWVHLMTSWNCNFASGSKIANLYINGVSDVTIVSDASSAFSTVGNGMEHTVGIDNPNGSVGIEFFNGSLAELYMAPTSFIDLSTLANRRKFLTATKRPAFLGVTGALPTGSQPPIYLKGSGTGFNVESGSLSNYTTVGTLTTPTTTPSNP
jgi:Concanavalin A-like lectin/glucanases superfamily